MFHKSRFLPGGLSLCTDFGFGFEFELCLGTTDVIYIQRKEEEMCKISFKSICDLDKLLFVLFGLQ